MDAEHDIIRKCWCNGKAIVLSRHVEYIIEENSLRRWDHPNLCSSTVIKGKDTMIEKGKVISINDGLAVVMLTPSEKCGECRLCSRLQPGGKMSLEVEAVEGLHPGQVVTIQIDSRQILKGGWTVFILPLIAFIVGAAAAPDLTQVLGVGISGELASILLGGLLLGLTFLGIYLRSRSLKYREKLTPKIVDFR